MRIYTNAKKLQSPHFPNNTFKQKLWEAGQNEINSIHPRRALSLTGHTGKIDERRKTRAAPGERAEQTKGVHRTITEANNVDLGSVT